MDSRNLFDSAMMRFALVFSTEMVYDLLIGGESCSIDSFSLYVCVGLVTFNVISVGWFYRLRDLYNRFKNHADQISPNMSLIARVAVFDLLMTVIVGMTKQTLIRELINVAILWVLMNMTETRDTIVSVYRQLMYGSSSTLLSRIREPNSSQVKSVQDLEKICPICLDTMKTSRDANKQLIATPCGHIFHQDCLSEWADVQTTCPTCRMEF